jgi:two-component sensor histidine kinase
LLLRETDHRHANDLQLVVSLLALQSRRAETIEAKIALTNAMERVAVLARARAALGSQDQLGLGSALRQVCQALHSYAEPRGISVSVDVPEAPPALSANRIAMLALAVNELATNAIKHAFREEQGGSISIVLHRHDGAEACVTVDDDGLPLPDSATTGGNGLGFGLVRRLIASVGGTFTPPADGTKRFEIRMPSQPM